MCYTKIHHVHDTQNIQYDHDDNDDSALHMKLSSKFKKRTKLEFEKRVCVFVLTKKRTVSSEINKTKQSNSDLKKQPSRVLI
jgi:hypothetical protein